MTLVKTVAVVTNKNSCWSSSLLVFRKNAYKKCWHGEKNWAKFGHFVQPVLGQRTSRLQLNFHKLAVHREKTDRR